MENTIPISHQIRSIPMNYKAIFDRMNPDFFRDEKIRRLSERDIFTELVLDLHDAAATATAFPVLCPKNITFGAFHGDLSVIHDAVRKVDADWVQYFNRGNRFLCAFDKGKVVSFCILDDMGTYDGAHIGGPGCVGTVPEYRKRGIGLEMIRMATEQFRKDGYDLSWVHFTHLDRWYSRLGYQVVLRWNCHGFV